MKTVSYIDENIYSIERSQNSCVHFVFDNLTKALSNLLAQIHEPVSSWQVGHFMRQDAANKETTTSMNEKRRYQHELRREYKTALALALA